MAHKYALTKQHIKSIFSNNTEPLASPESVQQAIENIEKQDFPNLKTKGWEKTDITNIRKYNYRKPKFAEIKEEYIRQFTFYGIDSDLLVFSNGYFDEKNSLIKSAEEIYIGSLKAAITDMPKVVKRYFGTVENDDKTIFNSINSAYTEDGFLIYVPDNAEVSRTVHIMNFIDSSEAKPFVQSRNLIVLGKNTKMDIINSYHSVLPDFTFNNVYTEIIEEENAELNYYLFQGEGNEATQINKTVVQQEKKSIFKSNIATMCGTVVKNEIQANITEENCHTETNGIYLPARRQTIDNSILINHLVPNRIL